MHNHPALQEILITKEQIQTRIEELAAQISKDYAGKRPLVIGILKGSVVFFADLIRAMDLDVQIDFMSVSSYGSSTVTSGTVTVLKDLSVNCANRHVIIVEDIVDSGVTLSRVREMLKGRNASSVAIATLLSKPSRRIVDVPVEYIGFEIPDKFVVGYGMDFDERFRGLSEIGVLKPEMYS